MSIIIEISDEGSVEAIHNSGVTLWSWDLNMNGEHVDEKIADIVKEHIYLIDSALPDDSYDEGWEDGRQDLLDTIGNQVEGDEE